MTTVTSPGDEAHWGSGLDGPILPVYEEALPTPGE